jgi:hypothetical protein
MNVNTSASQVRERVNAAYSRRMAPYSTRSKNCAANISGTSTADPQALGLFTLPRPLLVPAVMSGAIFFHMFCTTRGSGRVRKTLAAPRGTSNNIPL